MGIKSTRAGTALNIGEPYASVTFLPACGGCGQPHPRALNLDTNVCQNCGTTCAIGNTTTVAAGLAGFSPQALSARLFFGLGRTFKALAGRI